MFSDTIEGEAGAKECCHLTPDLLSVGLHLNKYMGFRFARICDFMVLDFTLSFSYTYVYEEMSCSNMQEVQLPHGRS